MSVTLSKINDGETVDTLTVRARQGRSILPWYPLMGHRQGLRMNDLITLASAFWIEANERNASAQAMAMSQPDPDFVIVKHAPSRPQDHFGHTDPNCNCA